MALELSLPCGVCAPVQPMSVDREALVLRCARCGHERPFAPRPLYLVTGPPASGKTGVVERLVGRLPAVPIFDTDLWGGVAHRDWEAWAVTWLLVAHGLADRGMVSVLCGYGLRRSSIEGLPARSLIGPISVLNLDLAEDSLRERLRRRPGYDEDRIARKMAMAVRLRAEADVNLDTTRLSPRAVADAVEEWLRRRLEAQAVE